MQVMDFLGSAAFSKAVQALDIKTGMLVCLKIVKVTALPIAAPHSSMHANGRVSSVEVSNGNGLAKHSKSAHVALPP